PVARRASRAVRDRYVIGRVLLQLRERPLEVELALVRLRREELEREDGRGRLENLVDAHEAHMVVGALQAKPGTDKDGAGSRRPRLASVPLLREALTSREVPRLRGVRTTRSGPPYPLPGYSSATPAW